MPLFQCQSCGTIDNTALTGQYWGSEIKKCTECASGKWHDKFPKRDAFLVGYFTDGRYIYSPEEVDQKKMVWKYNPAFKIIGKCPPINQDETNRPKT